MTDFSREIGWPLHPIAVGVARPFGLAQHLRAAGHYTASRKPTTLRAGRNEDSPGGLGA